LNAAKEACEGDNPNCEFIQGGCSVDELHTCDFDKFDVSIAPLGMQDSRIQDSQLSCSDGGCCGGDWDCNDGRLEGPRAWIANRHGNPGSWIQVDFQADTLLTGFSIQSRRDSGQMTSRVNIMYGSSSTPDKSAGEYDGNNQVNTIVKHDFPTPFVARYARLVSVAHRDNGWPSLRMEWFGSRDIDDLIGSGADEHACVGIYNTTSGWCALFLPLQPHRDFIPPRTHAAVMRLR
jgi:hypothetical protein